VSAPDLFVVCKNCQAEVSPYITECPYCGQRLRKRAPKIERPDAPAKPPKRGPRVLRRARTRAPKAQQSSAPGLGRLRSGEIPGIRADEHGRPWATIVLVVLSFGLWLSLGFYVKADFALTALSGDPWRFFTAALLNDGTAAQFAAIIGLGLFGWMIERRHGPLAVIALFLLCGPGALAAATAIDPGSLVFGTHAAALGMLCAWLVPTLLARQRGGAEDADLLGALVIGAVLLLVPLLSQGSALAGAIGAVVGALAGLALAALKPVS
jgi:membrane associated rhomboid family serine protease